MTYNNLLSPKIGLIFFKKKEYQTSFCSSTAYFTHTQIGPSILENAGPWVVVTPLLAIKFTFSKFIYLDLSFEAARLIVTVNSK